MLDPSPIILYPYFIIGNCGTYLLVTSAAMQPILIGSGSEKLVPYPSTLT